jgi:hypothetical protein
LGKRGNVVIKKENVTIFLFGVLTIEIFIVVMFMWTGKVPERADSILIVFIGTLATISALIFTIPLFFRSSREGTIYPGNDEKLVICYLCVFILGIFFSLLALIVEKNIEFSIALTGTAVNSKLFFFKLSLVIFLICLVWLIPYLFIFLRRDTIKAMAYFRNSIIDKLSHIPSNGGGKSKETIKREINCLERVILQVLSSHNYMALDYGISSLMEITYKIIGKQEKDNRFIRILDRALRESPVNSEVGNFLLKEIMKSFRDVSVACIECRSDEYSRRIGKYMKKVIIDGLRTEKNLRYPNLVLYIERLGVEAAGSNLEETTDEIINSLGQIGYQSIAADLQCSPILAVLRGLQNIGVVCTEKKMVHQCATTRTRIIEIARLGEKSMQEEALRRFWVVTAFMYRNIPEITEANFRLEMTLRREFGGKFLEQLDRALGMLHKEGEWIRKRVVGEFKCSTEFSKIFADQQ